MIIGVEFKDGMAELKVVSAEDSELKELPRFAQDLISTKLSSDGITKMFKLLEAAFTEDVLGKYNADDNGCIDDNNKNFLKDFNNEKFYDSNVNFADKVKKPKNINTSNKNVPMSHTLEKIYKEHTDTIISLYEEYKNAKRLYKKYLQMLSILKDIRADEYISDNDRALIDAKIKVYEGKASGLNAAYEKLMKAISEV